MNRTAAQNATQEINEMERRNFEGRNLPPSTVADIIERACGQGADSEKVGNNFLTPKLKALDLYYAQKDGCPNGHPSGAGKICVDCVAQALAERSCEHDGIESVLLMFYRHIDRFGVDPKDRTEQSQSQVRCFDAYWKLKTEERSCGETAWVSLGFEVERFNGEDGVEVLIRDTDSLEWTSGVVWARSSPETIVTMLADAYEALTRCKNQENKACPACAGVLEPHGQCSQCGEYPTALPSPPTGRTEEK